MSAVCGDRAGGRDPGRVSLPSSVRSCCVRGALHASLLCCAAACSEEQYNPPISGNMGGSAGQSGSAGAAGASGGTAGAMGNAGSAGSGSTGPGMSYTFASDLEGFRINYYCVGPQAADPANCVPVMAAPAPPAAVADAGGDAAAEDGGAAGPLPPAGNDFVAAEFDGALGSPDPGSAKISLQFSVDGQLADFARNFGSNTAAGLNLTGKTLTVQARVEAGGAPTVAGKIYVKTGSTYSYADAGETTLTPGSWTTLRYATPTYYANMAVYDISDVREIGIEILGRGATAVMPTIVHIDTIAY
jgi:hypothetical protein